MHRWDDNIIIYLKQIQRVWSGFSGSRLCPVAGCCEYGNELLGLV